MANETYIPNGIDVDGSKIINLQTPTQPFEAANKFYVDSMSGGGAAWNNVVIVNDVATDLPAPVAGDITLLANTTYWFNEGTHVLVDRLILSNNTNIFGFGKNNTILQYNGVSSLLVATNSNLLIRDVEIQAPSNGSAMAIINTASFSVYLEDVNIRGCGTAGTINGGGFFAKYVLVVNCQTAGFTFTGTLGSVILDTCSFRPLLNALVNRYAVRVLSGATGTSFRMYNCIIDTAAGHYGLWIVGTYTLTAGGILRGNIFSGAGSVAQRLTGVNGNTAGWTIVYGENSGIAGIQYVDVEVISTADASLGNAAGTYIEGSTVRGYILPLANYDPLATVMEAQITALMTNATGSGVQLGLRNLTTGTSISASLGVATEGNLVAVTSVFTAITPNNNYNAYYVKNTGSSTRFALKIRIKIY